MSGIGIDPDAAAQRPEPAAKRNKILRLVGVVAFLAGLVVIGKLTGFSDRVTVESLRGWMADAGAWGVLVFVVVFVAGELIQIPGLIFVAVAVLSYGRLEGAVLSHLTAVLSVCISFALARFMGGKALAGIELPWVGRVMENLKDRPIQTVAILRATLVLAPPVNYALGLSSIKFRDYLIGSVVGLIPPILIFVTLFDQLMHWMEI
jgi:uncharacterized membrane protein YdjX (TVP38/TMEM64 family)